MNVRSVPQALVRISERLSRPTLRARIALMTGALLLTLNFGLVLFINMTAEVQVSDSGTLSGQLPGPGFHPQAWPAGAPTPTTISFAEYYPSPVGSAEAEPIRQTLLGHLRLSSFAALVLVSVIGSICAYWLAGRMVHYLAVFRQTTQSVSATTLDTRVASQHLDPEVRELADSFDAMLARLERSFTQQRHFASNAAHELRTPITILRTNLEVVKADPDATVDDYRELTPVFERTLARLESLISDLLVMATNEDSLLYDEISLKSLLEEVIDDYTALALKQGVTLVLVGTTDAVVRSDAALLSRAFSNLVENAIRYNHRDGRVIVEIDNSPTNTIISVADTGIGIPVEEQGHIFNRFYRVHRSRSRHKNGAGLGLSIVSHVVQLHGGQVHVESSPGLGSKFTVRLPA